MKYLMVLMMSAVAVSTTAYSKRNTFLAHRSEIIAFIVPQMEPRVWPNDKAAALQAATCLGDVIIAAASKLQCPVDNDVIASLDRCIKNSYHMQRVIASWLPDCAFAAKHHLENLFDPKGY